MNGAIFCNDFQIFSALLMIHKYIMESLLNWIVWACFPFSNRFSPIVSEDFIYPRIRPIWILNARLKHPAQVRCAVLKIWICRKSFDHFKHLILSSSMKLDGFVTSSSNFQDFVGCPRSSQWNRTNFRWINTPCIANELAWITVP